MSISSLQAKAFVAGLPNSAKQELLDELYRDLHPGEPVYEEFNGKTSRQIVQEWSYSQNILYEHLDLSRLYHTSELLSHCIVALLIERTTVYDDFPIHIFASLIIDTLSGKLMHSYLETTFDMIYNTKKLSKYHSLVKRIQGEYNRFHALRSGLDRKLLFIDLPESSDEKEIVLNHWSNLGGDLMDSIYKWIVFIITLNILTMKE